MYTILYPLIINIIFIILKDKLSFSTRFIFPLLMCHVILHNFKHKVMQSYGEIGDIAQYHKNSCSKGLWLF